jgi:C4-dicarboxylate transporter DctM subunit
MGPIIPPSIPMVVYGSLSGVSIGKLFLGGVIPGLLLGLAIMLTHAVIARRRDHPSLPRASVGQVARTGVSTTPIALLPVVIVGGIVSGKFTAVEAGAIAVVIAILLGLGYRGLSTGGFGRALGRFAETLGPLMFIIATSGIFSLVLTLEGTGPRLVNFVRPIIDALGGGSAAVLIVLIVACLILGCFVESLTLMIILGPILTQVATAYGVNPVHFGVCFVVAVLMGTVHPPLGYALMIGSRIGRVSQEEMIPQMFLFIVPMLAVLTLMIFFPEIVTFIPDRVITK